MLLTCRGEVESNQPREHERNGCERCEREKDESRQDVGPIGADHAHQAVEEGNRAADQTQSEVEQHADSLIKIRDFMTQHSKTIII